MRMQTLVSFMTGHRGPLTCLALLWLATAPGGAQTAAQGATQTGIQLDTGLLSFFTGDRRSVKVTVSEVSGRSAQSQVRVVFLDASDRPVARHDAVLSRGRPVSLELPLTSSEVVMQLRASITIIGAAKRQSAPVVVLEDIDANTFTVGQRVTCAPPATREGPVTPYCPGTVISHFTTGS